MRHDATTHAAHAKRMLHMLAHAKHMLNSHMQSQTHSLSAQQAGRSARDVVAETAIDLGRYGHLSSFPGVAAYRPDFAAVASTIL